MYNSGIGTPYAVKLGYKYCNALFELKNTPKDLVYWRMKVQE